MKKISKIIAAACLLWSSHAVAQEVKPSLDAAPAPALTDMPAPKASATASSEAAKEKPAWTGPRMSYSLSTGMSFSNGFGNTQFITPSVRYQVSNRFRVNAGLTYMHVSPYNMPAMTSEGTTMMYRNSGGSHYIANAGVEYLASDRLILSGNIWKDFSNLPPMEQFGYGGLYSPGRMGADFQATYKITDNLSVSGGVRYTNGASPYASPFYNNPGFGNYPGSRFGY